MVSWDLSVCLVLHIQLAHIQGCNQGIDGLDESKSPTGTLDIDFGGQAYSFVDGKHKCVKHVPASYHHARDKGM